MTRQRRIAPGPIGPDIDLEWLSAVSEAMATEESGGTVAPDMISDIARLREGPQRALRER